MSAPKKSKDNELLERILPETTVGNVFSQNPKMTARNVNVFYDKNIYFYLTFTINQNKEQKEDNKQFLVINYLPAREIDDRASQLLKIQCYDKIL